MQNEEDKTRRERRLLAVNAIAIGAVLTQLGYAHATAEYTGGGDSGNGHEVRAFRDGDEAGEDVPDDIVTIVAANPSYDKELGATVYVEEERELTLDQALEHVCEFAIDAFGHSGWENNEGGEGKLTVHADGGLELEHSDYYTECDTSTHELDLGEIQALAAGVPVPTSPEAQPQAAS